MGRLAEIDFKIDTLLKGYFEDNIFLLRGEIYGDSGKIRRAAVA